MTNEGLARDYLEKSTFSPMQADALSKLLCEMATKEDLQYLSTKADLSQAIADSRAEMMRWGFTMIIAMSTVFTLLDIFID